jgi:hypothetical protein
MADIAPVGKVLFRRGNAPTPTCPLCNNAETNVHLWQCGNSEIGEIFESGYESIEAMLSIGPLPFKHYILRQMRILREGIMNNRHAEEMDDYAGQQALLQQSKFGVIAGIWGFYHIKVVNLLNEHFGNTRISSVHWVAKIIL